MLFDLRVGKARADWQCRWSRLSGWKPRDPIASTSTKLKEDPNARNAESVEGLPHVRSGDDRARRRSTSRSRAGEIVAIMGPSGCGKSTLLNILGMLDSPSAASTSSGEEVSGYPERKLAQLRKRNIGFIFQSFNLIDELTVFANVELPLLYQRVPEAERKRRVDAVLEKMGIVARRDSPATAALGRPATARRGGARGRRAPKLILADEPTGNLDTANGEEVMKHPRAAATRRAPPWSWSRTRAATRVRPAHRRHARRPRRDRERGPDAEGREQCLGAISRARCAI